MTLERYSSHTEGAYLFSLCKPHVEGIWVFALVCLDIQEICKLCVVGVSWDEIKCGFVFFSSVIVVDISVLSRGFCVYSAFCFLSSSSHKLLEEPVKQEKKLIVLQRKYICLGLHLHGTKNPIFCSHLTLSLIHI